MTDQLRALAVAEFNADPDAQYPTASNAFVCGFIAGRTSVTREQVAKALARGDWSIADEYTRAMYLVDADAILALLNGENDD